MTPTVQWRQHSSGTIFGINGSVALVRHGGSVISVNPCYLLPYKEEKHETRRAQTNNSEISDPHQAKEEDTTSEVYVTVDVSAIEGVLSLPQGATSENVQPAENETNAVADVPSLIHFDTESTVTPPTVHLNEDVDANDVDNTSVADLPQITPPTVQLNEDVDANDVDNTFVADLPQSSEIEVDESRGAASIDELLHENFSQFDRSVKMSSSQAAQTEMPVLSIQKSSTLPQINERIVLINPDTNETEKCVVTGRAGKAGAANRNW